MVVSTDVSIEEIKYMHRKQEANGEAAAWKKKTEMYSALQLKINPQSDADAAKKNA